MTPKLEVVLGCQNLLGESVLWDEDRQEVQWVNIHDGELWRLGSEGQVRVHQLPDRLGAIGLRGAGGLVVGLASGFALFDLDSERLGHLELVEPELPTTRLNDGRVDRQGRFVCGGMDEADDQRPITSVYQLGPDQAVRCILSGISCANSTCFSPDGEIMYFSDMPTRTILAYRYDTGSGIPHDPQLFADLSGEKGLPDGSTVDADGCLWNAQWGGGRVVRYTPAGRVDRVITLPVSNPTCVALGGREHRTLFITSARFGLTDGQLALEPMAGDLLALDSTGPGLPEPRYLG